MTALDVAALPLLAIPHNWIDDVAVTRTWPTAVRASRNGTEQRAGLALQPRETWQLRLTAASVEACTQLLHTLLATGTPGVDGTLTDAPLRAARRVRVPRWEDGRRLITSAGIGGTVLYTEAGVLDRAFVNGGAVALWRPDATVVVVDLDATVGAADDETLTLAAALTSDDGAPWLTGTLVAPVETAWLDPDAIERLTGAASDGTLRLTRDARVAGERSSADGQATAPVVASLTLRVVTLLGTQTGPYVGQQLRLVATPRDATGAPVDAPGGLTWTSDQPAMIPVRVNDPTGRVAFAEALPGFAAGDVNITVSDPDSGLSAIVNLDYAP